MILATTKVEDYERFLEIFSTKGAEKRREHGSKGVTVFGVSTRAAVARWAMQHALVG
jgi:hypothetical protein